jgi:hypothetical protein
VKDITDSSRQSCSSELVVHVQLLKKLTTLIIKILKDKTVRYEKITIFLSFQRVQQTTTIIDKAKCRSNSDNCRAESHKSKTKDNFKLTFLLLHSLKTH